MHPHSYKLQSMLLCLFSLGTPNEQIHFGQCIVISTGVTLDE
jgi:hypothetical protein